jgi:hypothetical protein
MRLRRAALCLVAISALAVSAAPASAAKAKPKPKPAPKPICNLLSDPRDDAAWDVAPPVTSPALDILGADVATGPTTLVARLRVADPNIKFPSDKYGALGYVWRLGFYSTLGTAYSFELSRTTITGTDHYQATVDGVNVPVTFQVVSDGFQWTIKRTSSPKLAKKGNVFRLLSANSNVLSATADTTDLNKATYPDRALSCVKAS